MSEERVVTITCTSTEALTTLLDAYWNDYDVRIEGCDPERQVDAIILRAKIFDHAELVKLPRQRPVERWASLEDDEHADDNTDDPIRQDIWRIEHNLA